MRLHRIMIVTCVAFAALIIIGASAANAGEVDLYLFGESFTWKEFETDGTRMLKENGPLYGIGYAYRGRIALGEEDYYDLEDTGSGASLTLSPRIELFGGKVDYTGQACDLSGTCTPSLSETGHAGGKIEFDMGIADGGAVRLELFAGAGVRGWVRTIDDSRDSTGAQVQGYAERWISTYGRTGVRADIRFLESSRFFVEATVKKPFSNSETIYMSDVSLYLDDVTVNPGKKSSIFYEVGLKLAAFKISAFYETLRFSESKHVLKYNSYLGDYLDVSQPKSEADIYGLRIGAAF